MNGFWYRLLPVSVDGGDDHTDAQANWGSSCLDVSLVMLIWTNVIIGKMECVDRSLRGKVRERGR